MLFATVEELAQQSSNEGKWGPDDELGATSKNWWRTVHEMGAMSLSLSPPIAHHERGWFSH